MREKNYFWLMQCVIFRRTKFNERTFDFYRSQYFFTNTSLYAAYTEVRWFVCCFSVFMFSSFPPFGTWEQWIRTDRDNKRCQYNDFVNSQNKYWTRVSHWTVNWAVFTVWMHRVKSYRLFFACLKFLQNLFWFVLLYKLFYAAILLFNRYSWFQKTYSVFVVEFKTQFSTVFFGNMF